MGWLVNNFLGNGTTPEADNAETGTWEQLAEKTANLPMDIVLTDISLSEKADEDHEYQLFVNGKAQENFLFSDMLDPGSDGRFKIADQGLVIPRGAAFQIRSAQKTGDNAEATKLVIKYAEV